MKVIKESNDGRLKEPTVKDYTKQILDGLDYLHSNNVIHMDLKARNILLDNRNVLKLADFGLSIKLPESAVTSRRFNTCKGTCTHMAPEMIDPKFGKWGRKVDIWYVRSSKELVIFLLLKFISIKTPK